MMNIIDLISQDVRLTKRGKEWRGLCPFHQEKTPSFSVSEERGLYYCYGCGKGGDAISWLRDYRGLTFPEAAALVGKELPETDRARHARERAVKERLLTAYWQWYHVQLRTWPARLQDLTTRIEIAEIGYRATIRKPDLYTEAEKDYWAGRLAALYEELPAIEHTCDILTYDHYERERFAWWQAEQKGISR